MYNDEEIESIRASCQLVSRTLGELKRYIKPGTTLDFLDKVAEKFILSNGGKPAFKGYKNFPATLCLSINEEVVHGIPTTKRLKNGDIISVDCGVQLGDFFGDSAYTFPVGDVHPSAIKLLETTKDALYAGIAQACVGNTTAHIGTAIEKHVKAHGYSVVRKLTGHGIGRQLHESPSVPNFTPADAGDALLPGMVIAIEPMVNAGTDLVKEANDGWTVYTADRKLSAHFEHTIAITDKYPIVLTNFSFEGD